MKKPIQLFLFSGFLGAGKTTLLKNILQHCSEYKVGVLVNEFGSVGIDGETLSNEEINLVEINNGSIFCMCLKAGFLKALQEFSKTSIDVLFIENSGLGDPSSIQKILNEVSPYLDRPYDYRGAVCVVDCTTYAEYSDILPPVENQVRSSQFILINKTDLVTKDRIAEIRKLINGVNPGADIYETIYSNISVETILSKLKASDFSGESSNKDWNRPIVYIVKGDQPVSENQLKSMISALLDKAVRIKGFIRSEDAWWNVDAAGKQTDIRPCSTIDPEKQYIVIIGKDQEPFIDNVRSEWHKYLNAEPEIKIE